MDFEAIRARLAKTKGKEYWRSLEELAGSEAFQESLRREFPNGASEWSDVAGRRNFLRLMGASLALAGLTACTRQPTETIVPYVHPALGITLGVPLYFATAMPLGGAAEGLLVESHEGRPTKIEGNPNHPASLGATSLFAQASVLTLYNPDRAHTVTNVGEIRPWGAFTDELQRLLAEKSASRGAGLRILTGTVSSPTLFDQIKTLAAGLPAAKWHQYEPVNRDNAMAGARMAFGEPVNAIYRLENADVILSLDADFLACGPASLRYARDFANRRRLLDGDREMNRLYVVEGSMTNTGAVADHRFPLRPSEIEGFAREVAAGLGIQAGVQSGNAQTKWRRWIDPLARDLQQHRGRSLVIAGDSQPPAVHALAHVMNQALGNAGATVVYVAPLEADPVDQTQSLSELARDMDAGQVDLLVIAGGNPVYDAPADLKFAERMSKVKTRVQLSLFHDETSELCHWHIPESHYLETWSDARAYDGAVTIIQPLIAPLYESKSAHELLAALSGRPQQSGYEIVRDYWMGRRGAKAQPAQTPPPIPARVQNEQEAAQVITQLQARPQPTAFDQWWQEVLRKGIAPDTAFQPKQVSA
ncbi:MAG TPA: TAT-variant-translocated molybdopterin oxidoreductase, partial [Candidatus Solibacter sp.]|nr:TAT-variant-translocated molybdopterin oxidoreductase [Candidatus Solibacter sp.]